MAERRITFGASAEETGPKAIVTDIRNAVASALMGDGLPGAFTLTDPSGKVKGTISLRPTISVKDGRVMYHADGDLSIGSLILPFNGNALFPKKGPKVYRVTGQDFADYKVAKTALAAKAAAPREQSDEDLEAGEST